MEGELTKELNYGLEYDKEKKELKISLEFEGKFGAVELAGKLPADKLVMELARIIPGELDDVVLKMLLAAL
jgi:hypothetical protein